MRKRRPRLYTKPFPPTGCLEPAFPADTAQRQHHPHFRQQADLGLEVRPAQLELRQGRPVVRRSAPRRRGDETPCEDEVVVSRAGLGLAGPAETVQRFIQPVTTGITGKRPSGPVASMRPGSQAHNQQMCPRIAKAGHGFAPILLVGVFPLPDPRDLATMRPEPGAALAAVDLTGQVNE